MRDLARAGQSNPWLNSFVSTIDFHAGGPAPVALEFLIRQHYTYRDEREEVLRTVPHMVERLHRTGKVEGDCDDIAVFLAACLLIMNVGVRFVAIRFDRRPDFGHVFVQWFNGSDWVTMDPTVAPGTLYQEDERLIFYV